MLKITKAKYASRLFSLAFGPIGTPEAVAAKGPLGMNDD